MLDEFNEQSTEAATWEEVKELYTQCETLLHTGVPLVNAIDPRTNGGVNISPTPHFTQLCKTLASDLTFHSTQLYDTYNSHKDKSGVCNSPDDLMFAMQLSEVYREWIISFRSTVVPLIAEIANIVSPQITK